MESHAAVEWIPDPLDLTGPGTHGSNKGSHTYRGFIATHETFSQVRTVAKTDEAPEEMSAQGGLLIVDTHRDLTARAFPRHPQTLIPAP